MPKLLPTPALRVLPQLCRESSLVERACCQCHNGLAGICFAGLEVEAVELEEENANHKPRPLVATDTGQCNLLASFQRARILNSLSFPTE